MRWQYNDGGRRLAGRRGDAGDCVCRSIAIATGLPYSQVYDDLNSAAESERPRGKRRRSSARMGVQKATIRRYLSALGWEWIATMRIGTGCKVHLVDGELPDGRLIVSVSRHMTAVIDGVIQDTHDPQRSTLIVENGKQRIAGRCVYGYWKQSQQSESEG